VLRTRNELLSLRGDIENPLTACCVALACAGCGTSVESQTSNAGGGGPGSGGTGASAGAGAGGQVREPPVPTRRETASLSKSVSKGRRMVPTRAQAFPSPISQFEDRPRGAERSRSRQWGLRGGRAQTGQEAVLPGV
jgi:hypothetical protein